MLTVRLVIDGFCLSAIVKTGIVRQSARVAGRTTVEAGANTAAIMVSGVVAVKRMLSSVIVLRTLVLGGCQ